MIPAAADPTVRTQACPRCYMCGESGDIAYHEVSDRVFGSPGEWTLRRCCNASCGLLWLDPMPVEPDLPLLYRGYYTHDSEDAATDGASSEPSGSGAIGGIYRFLLRVTGVERQRSHLSRMYLDERSPGKVLDVGCGNGDRLVLLRQMGWEAEGQDIDPEACRVARSTSGSTVHVGQLKNLSLPDSSFDAIVMNHVIEHIHDPRSLLSECLRLLKAGGWLMATTPNARSTGLRRFGRHWRGLEVPRHLYLFTPDALGKAAGNAGFQSTQIWTSSARCAGMVQASLEIRDQGQHKMGSRPGFTGSVAKALLLYQPAFLALNLLCPLVGEECVLRAIK